MTELERLEKLLTELPPTEFLDYLKRIDKTYASYRILMNPEPLRVEIGSSRDPVLFDGFRNRVIEQIRIWKQNEYPRFEQALRTANIPTDESLRLGVELQSLVAADKSNEIASESNRIATKSNVIAIISLIISIAAAIVAVISLIN